MEEYKVGDKVRIIPRTMSISDYPFTYVDEMAAMAGKECIIQEISSACDDRCSINGDYHLYTLYGGDGYNWHSSMFEKVDGCASDKVKSVTVKADIPIINIKSTSKIKVIL